jgi:hypothetical protein|tara:strand:- start:805 stop:1125 length:321 start_codon:yes stop_codon:yes gene_type:complete
MKEEGILESSTEKTSDFFGDLGIYCLFFWMLSLFLSVYLWATPENLSPLLINLTIYAPICLSLLAVISFVIQVKKTGDSLHITLLVLALLAFFSSLLTSLFGSKIF